MNGKGDALVPLMAFGMPDFEQILCKVRVVKAKPGRDCEQSGQQY
jgi:hypothetical protein